MSQPTNIAPALQVALAAIPKLNDLLEGKEINIDGPVDLGPALRLYFAVLPKISEILTDQTVTVGEAIEVVHVIAKQWAAEAGVTDEVIALIEQPEQ